MVRGSSRCHAAVNENLLALSHLTPSLDGDVSQG